MKQNEEKIPNDYNHNEIHNAETVAKTRGKYSVRRILSYIVMAALIFIVIAMVVSIIAGGEFFNVIRRPRMITLPLGFTITYAFLVLKSDKKAQDKDVLLLIIDGISDPAAFRD